MTEDEGGLRAVPLPAGWDEAVLVHEDPATIPDRLRAEIDRLMSLYPERHSATLPALAAAQRVHGWCSPEAIRQVASVMQVTPAYLSSIATFYDMLRTTPSGTRYLYVCTSVARWWTRPGNRALRTWSCASSNVWGPATWHPWPP